MIDFHCHLDLYPKPSEIIQGCIERKIYVLSVTTTPSAWEVTANLSSRAKRINTALGLHPQLAHQRKSELKLFEKLLPAVKYVGEIGLDGLPEFEQHRSSQVEVFEEILQACQNIGGRVLSIHSRRAASDVLDCLTKTPGAGVPIMHWFSGSHRELARAIKMGCWFSVGPGMLNSAKGRKLAEKMPRNRLLTESDGPFAKVSRRPAVPWDCENVVLELSRLWAIPFSDVECILSDNLKRLVS